MSTFERAAVCHAVVGHDQDGRGIGCGKPRCEEAGRRALCLEHWQELQRERARLVWKDRGLICGAHWWFAKASRSIGGDYHITQYDRAEGAQFKIHYRAKARKGGTGLVHWLEQTGDTLEQAQAIAQSDHDALILALTIYDRVEG